MAERSPLIIMIAAIDVYYYDDRAKASAILFHSWKDAAPALVKSVYINNVAGYELGAFYKRELPCIEALLKALDEEKINLIIVDSYVYLYDSMKAGLGGHLHSTLKEKTPVIGVAKTFFSENRFTKPLLRGESKNPLYISAAGIPLEEAVAHIASMHGNFRIPTLLKLLDRETKADK